MPKVSIILSSYNHAKFIRESIDSALKQTFSDFELIIWDDGSSDDSWELIGQYSDPRIKAYRNEKNIGGVFGVNKAISEIATGEYIAIHHSDDVWELDKLQKQVDCLEVNPDVGAVFTNTKPIDERGQPLADQSHFHYSIFNQPNRSRQEWLRHFFFRGNALCHPSVLIRKQCYADCGMYQDALAQLTDFDMWVRLCFKYEIRVLPDRLVRFRVRDGEMNASGSRPEVRIRDRSEFHYVLKRYSHIDTFDELVSIFPEVEQFRRPDDCVPKFVFAMAALGDNSFPWARLLAIGILFDLLTDPDTKEKIRALYQFSYKELISLTGQHDVFALETVTRLNDELYKCTEMVSRLLPQEGKVATSNQPFDHAWKDGAQEKTDLDNPLSERAGYEEAERLFAVGRSKEGRNLLEKLASQGSSCWEVYNDLAVQCFNAGEQKRAEELFAKGMTLEGNAGIVARNYASMKLAGGEIGAALEVLGRILREQPGDADVIETLRQILSNVPQDSPDLWKRLAVVAQTDDRTSSSAKVPASREGCRQVANDVRIFQIFYDERTRAQLDPAFMPLDNLDNPRPDWCEYWPIRKVLLEQTFDDDTYLGFFSPRFFEKTRMRGEDVLAVVRQSVDEVVSFSPFFDQGAIHINPFMQGEVNHPGMVDVAQDVLKSLDIKIDLQSIVCDRTTTIFSNYFVARYSFWKRWFACFEHIYAICEGPDSALKSRLLSYTKYRAGTDYQMKIFILERLVTVLMEESHLQCELALDIRHAPMSFPGTEKVLDELVVTDWLKGRFRVTGQVGYLEIFGLYVGRLAHEVLKPVKEGAKQDSN
ncbi:glycosyltransferase [Sideroxydans sp.]